MFCILQSGSLLFLHCPLHTSLDSDKSLVPSNLSSLIGKYEIELRGCSSNTTFQQNPNSTSLVSMSTVPNMTRHKKLVSTQQRTFVKEKEQAQRKHFTPTITIIENMVYEKRRLFSKLLQNVRSQHWDSDMKTDSITEPGVKKKPL